MKVRREVLNATNRKNLLAAFLTVAAAVHAQTSRGTVTGTVLVPTGSVIAGAQITLTAVETGIHFSTKSNDTGVYRSMPSTSAFMP